MKRFFLCLAVLSASFTTSVASAQQSDAVAVNFTLQKRASFTGPMELCTEAFTAKIGREAQQLASSYPGIGSRVGIQISGLSETLQGLPPTDSHLAEYVGRRFARKPSLFAVRLSPANQVLITFNGLFSVAEGLGDFSRARLIQTFLSFDERTGRRRLTRCVYSGLIAPE